MPKLYINAIDSEFCSRDDGCEYDHPEDALTQAVRCAAEMAVDEIRDGKTNAVIEVRIEQADGTTLLRSILSMSVSVLMPMG